MDASLRTCAFCGRLAPVLCTRCGTPYCARDGQRLCDACIAEMMRPEEYEKGGLVHPYSASARYADGLERMKDILDETTNLLLVNILALLAAPLLTIVSLLGFLLLPFAGRWVLLASLFLFLTMTVVAAIERKKLVARSSDLQRRIAALRQRYTEVALDKPVVQREETIPRAHIQPALT